AAEPGGPERVASEGGAEAARRAGAVAAGAGRVELSLAARGLLCREGRGRKLLRGGRRTKGQRPSGADRHSCAARPNRAPRLRLHPFHRRPPVCSPHYPGGGGRGSTRGCPGRGQYGVNKMHFSSTGAPAAASTPTSSYG